MVRLVYYNQWQTEQLFDKTALDKVDDSVFPKEWRSDQKLRVQLYSTSKPIYLKKKCDRDDVYKFIMAGHDPCKITKRFDNTYLFIGITYICVDIDILRDDVLGLLELYNYDLEKVIPLM